VLLNRLNKATITQNFDFLFSANCSARKYPQ
jgi:hypothetical protein